jgi:predicted RecA/RadA family phage recombinase
LGSGGALLLPDQSGSFPHILVQAGKQGRIYVVNRDQMTTSNSHYCSGCTNDPEIIEESASGAVGSMFTSPAYWNGSLFFWGTNDVLKSIPISSGIPDFAHLTGNTQVVNFPGPGLSVSSNGTTTGTAIVWAINAMEYGSPGPGPGPAILYAYDATNIQTLLYSSSQNAARDTAGNAVKFTVPTVANGKVYLGTSTEVDVYGLLGGGLPVTATPVINPASETTSSPIQVTIIDSTPASTIFYTTDNSTPSPTNGTKYTSAFTLTSSATVKAIATATNFQNSAVASAVYTIGSSSTTINYSSGFTPSGLTLSGSAKISGTRLRLTDTAGREAGSGFFSTPVNVQSFTTDFSFQLTSPNGDGFTFTIHGGSSAAALGASGGGLGYGPDTPGGTPGIPNSVAVKFDLYNNAGEGSDSTGIYTDGASPTVPSFDMTSSGVNLHSGDVFRVHMTYDGTNLAMTITDTSTGKVFSHTFSNINIPGAVGANAGYVGFTGGTGGSTAIQEIITWTFSSGTASQASTPQISPAPGSYTGPVTVTIMDATSGATITYTTDGSTPVPGSHGTAISSGGSFALTSTATVKAIASASGFSNSSIATAAYTITQSSQTPINFGSGFAGETTLILNGGASINGTRLRLTDSGGGEARSAFNTAAVSVSQFVSDFTFQLTNPIADGFTFTIQGISPTVVGPSGGGLGYGAGMPGGTPGIAKSVAIKFDLYNNAGEGADSTGAYLNGASPTIPASDMTSSGVNLHSGDVFHVHVTYDGVTLAWSITDTSTGKSFSSSTSVNIPSIVGSNTAYVGFTGGTGGSTATQEILTWTYSTSTSKASSIQFETESSVVFGASVSSGPTYRIFTWSGFTDGSGTTLDGTAIGQFVTITLNIPQAGTYDIRYATKKYFSRGIVQLSLNGTNVGPAEDQYAASDAWQEIDLGTVTLGAGNQQLKFSTTGKNASSSGFTQAYDYIKLIPQ